MAGIAEEVAAAAGLDMGGAEESGSGVLGVAEAEATDDNCDAAVVSAGRDRH
jgi:hypothetical protein